MACGTYDVGQTDTVIDPRFIYLALALSAAGGYIYVAATLRGVVTPNRVTWSLWGIEGVLAFGVELQQHVGLAALMTLMLGFVPWVVVLASFHRASGVWRIGPFDVGCALISLAGLIFWALVREPTIALISFVGADQVAALPTLRKSWIAPQSESSRAFFLGSFNCAVTLLTLGTLTTAGVLFPGCVMITDLTLTLLIVTRVGPRFRRARVGASGAIT